MTLLQALRKMENEGVSEVEMAKRMGVTVRLVRDLLKAAA